MDQSEAIKQGRTIVDSICTVLGEEASGLQMDYEGQSAATLSLCRAQL